MDQIVGIPRSFEEPEKREVMEINDTGSFRAALESDISAAEKWLDYVRQHRAEFADKYDDRWLDHQERALFQAYYKIRDWAGAKRVVEATADLKVKQDRKGRLEQLSGMRYESI